MKRNFTVIEFLIVIAVIALLLGTLFQAIDQARRKARYLNFREHQGYDLLTFEEYQQIERTDDDILKNELIDMTYGSLEAQEAKHFCEYMGHDTEGPSLSNGAYNIWVNYSGNPNSWTEEEFNHLLEENQVPDIYEAWVYHTGNVKKFTKEQFESLMSAGLIEFK